MTIRLISHDKVKTAMPVSQCIDSMGEAMVATSAGQVNMPGRHVMPLIDDSGFLGLMPGSCGSPRSYGVKVMSIHPGNPSRDLPMLQGAILLFNPDNGRPAALIDALEVTAIRTAAVSGLATRHLARADARTVVIFGYGVQAASHIDAMLAVRNVERFIIWGRSPEKAKMFCDTHASRLPCSIEFMSSSEQAAGMADIICTVTSAADPVLKGEWVRPGTHINLVGSHDPQHRECDTDLVAKASVFSDHTPFVIKEAGEITAALAEGVINEKHIKAELGEVVSGDKPGRQSDEAITLFKSLGLVSQDLLAADLVLRNADAQDLGIACEF